MVNALNEMNTKHYELFYVNQHFSAECIAISCDFIDYLTANWEVN